jgi:hypothetical protein
LGDRADRSGASRLARGRCDNGHGVRHQNRAEVSSGRLSIFGAESDSNAIGRGGCPIRRVRHLQTSDTQRSRSAFTRRICSTNRRPAGIRECRSLPSDNETWHAVLSSGTAWSPLLLAALIRIPSRQSR